MGTLNFTDLAKNATAIEQDRDERYLADKHLEVLRHLASDTGTPVEELSKLLQVTHKGNDYFVLQRVGGTKKVRVHARYHHLHYYYTGQLAEFFSVDLTVPAVMRRLAR